MTGGRGTDMEIVRARDLMHGEVLTVRETDSVDTLLEVINQLAARKPPRGYERDFLTRVPCTDMSFGTALVNKVANSTQVREKGLKILQYVLRNMMKAA